MRNLDTIETLETFVVLTQDLTVSEKPLSSFIFQKLPSHAAFLHLKHPLESSLSETKTAAS